LNTREEIWLSPVALKLTITFDIAGHPDLVAIQVVVDEAEIYDAVHRLRQLGGRGILVVPIDRMVA
jgi:ATP phosphoribosyltransferase-like protein